MSRTLSAPTSAATAQRITQPGYLMLVGFAFPIRYSSRGDVTFNGQLFVAADLAVGQLQQRSNGGATLSVKVGNTDRSFGTVCLATPPQDKAVTIWKFYEGATASADPIQIFSGTIESVPQIDVDAVTLQLTSLNRRTLFIPRRRITAATGFNHLMPAGRVIEWNNLRITINRDPE